MTLEWASCSAKEVIYASKDLPSFEVATIKLKIDKPARPTVIWICEYSRIGGRQSILMQIIIGNLRNMQVCG